MDKKPAVLYSRVSTTEQIDGDGLSRQSKLATQFLNAHQEYYLVETISDSLSGFKGHNISKGNLGKFIDDVKMGKYPDGTLLIIEAVDRLSRLPMNQAQKLFQELLDNNISIGICKFGIIIKHDEDSPHTMLSNAMLLSTSIYLANLESAQKSQRIKQAKQANLKNRVKCDRYTPFWLSLDTIQGEQVFTPKQDIIDRIIKIFEYRLMGNGLIKCVYYANELGLTTLTDKPYNTKTMKRLLTDKRLIGHYKTKGDLYKDWHPKVINEDLFWSVQNIFKDNVLAGRTSKQVTNYLRGLIKCPICGLSMPYLNKTSNGKLYGYFRCTSVQIGTSCGHKSVRSDLVLDSIKGYLSKLIAQGLAASANPIHVDSKRKAIQNQIDDIQAQLNKVESMIDMAGDDVDSLKLLMDVINKKNAEKRELNEKLNSIANENAINILPEEYLNLSLDTEEDLIRVNGVLHKVIDRILLDSKQAIFYFKGNKNPVPMGYGFMKAYAEGMERKAKYATPYDD